MTVLPSNLKDSTWAELKSIFNNYKKWDKQTGVRLQRLGYEVVYNSNHVKVYIPFGDKKILVTVGTTISDYNGGREILRTIKRVYQENEEVK